MMVQRRPHEDSVGFSRSVTYEYITNPTRPEPVSTMVITAPLFSKKVRKVCSTLFIPTGYTHSHTTSGPVRVVCAPRCEAVAGLASFAHCLGAQSPWGSQIFFIQPSGEKKIS